jgi:TonB family protein
LSERNTQGKLRLAWLPLAVIALALLAPAALCAEALPTSTPNGVDATELDARPELPAIPAPPAPVPEALFELLPPGARPLLHRVGVTDRSSSYGTRAVERIASPLLIGDTAQWVEVEYTVVPELDERVRAVLDRARLSLAHVILMDPATGEIFSYVSTDPLRFPATRPYPTASLMKVVTAAALLRTAPEAANRDCRYRGSPWELLPHQLTAPAKGGRVATFRTAIAISNNQCFARYAVSDLGEEALLEEIRRVGFLDPPGAGHAPGRVLPVRGRLSLGHLGSGMAGSFITPLSAARLAAALADGGMVHPYWIAGVRDADGNPLALPRRIAPRRGWSADVATELREVLTDVTAHGTARSAFHRRSGRPRLGPVRVAGKTGTVSGRNPAGRYQWFIGVAPSEAPRVAIATVAVDDDGSGHRAARIAADALAEVFCEEGRCDPKHAERLRARAARRDAALVAEIEERERLIAFQRARHTAATHSVIDLDQPPRPIGVSGFEFPRRLLRSPVDGEVVLLVEISEEGEVLGVQIASSDLPDFSDFVTREVRGWRFTPPTRAGRPVRATARLPIPIHIN